MKPKKTDRIVNTLTSAVLLLCTVGIALFLCACSSGKDPITETELPEQAEQNEQEIHNDPDGPVFQKLGNEKYRSPAGTEYEFLCNGGFLYYLGHPTLAGEASADQTQFCSIQEDPTDHILIGFSEDSEWFSIYRRADLVAFDYSLENCVRLELFPFNYLTPVDPIHATCQEGITDPEEIAAFVSDVCSQKDPREAGLYDLARKPDGTLENCYSCAVIYGFFEEEPYLAIPMPVTSYNDLAYSVSIGNEEYVLPEEWLQKLREG